MFEVNTSNPPYFDDYKPEKNFYKILYRPGYAVQTRELNQQQTMLQKQIERFGSHVFKDGSIIDGGSFDIEKSIDYVRGTSSTPLSNFVGREIVGQITGIKARVIHSHDDGTNAYLYIRYESATPTDDVFRNDEALFTNDDDLFEFTIGSDSVDLGKGSLFGISEGIVYFSGYFINFPAQRIVLEKDNDTASLNAIFKARFFTVNFNDDPSLLDNAQGSPNFTAPGADRLSAELTLDTIPLDQDLIDDEILLFSMENGFVTVNNERTLYARIYEEIAKRTHDESGDYNVRGMTVFTREHLDNGSNGGRFSLSDGGDNSLLSVGIEAGLSYVKGYEVNKLVTSYIDIDKSTDYDTVNNQISFVQSGNYILVDEISGIVDPTQGQSIDLYDTAEQRRTNLETYNVPASGTKIGTAKVKATLTENKTQVRVYVFDISMNDGSNIDDVRAIKSNTFFGNVVVAPAGNVIRDRTTDSLIFTTGANFVRSVRAEDGSTDTSFVRLKVADVNVTAAGDFTVTSTTNESIPYGTGTLGSLAKQSIMVSMESNVLASMQGTISCSGTTVTGDNTFFLTRVNAGERLVIGDGTTVIVESVDSDTQLTITTSETFPEQTFQKRFVVGDNVVLNGYGGNGTAREITSDISSLSFALNESFDTSFSAKVVYNVAQNEAREAAKTLVPNVYVKINANTLSDTSKLNLGISDVYRIKSIRASSSDFTSEDDGFEVTNRFIFNNGQKNSLYDHAYLTPKRPLDGDEYILVKLDHFVPDFSGGFGYFSVDSYPIDDVNEASNTIFTYQIPKFKSAEDGTEYNLRNHLDFRPVKSNTASSATEVINATENPPETEAVLYGASGLGIPTPGSNITYDYSFYLARKDVITLDTNGVFGVVSGKPSTNPGHSPVPDNVMSVARVYIPPYPSIASTYARILGRESIGTQSSRMAHKRYTMRDIGVIDSRVKTLEYYNALNLLEKSAVDMTILDENGLDRFKNGFFVDGFLDHSLGARYNDDYNISVDGKEQVIRPIFEMDSFDLHNTNVTNLMNTGGLITMPYTETSLIEQNYATTFRNIEQSVYRFIGVLDIDPPVDMWVDETTVDKSIHLGAEESDVDTSELEYKWGSWEDHVTGYNAYNREYGDRTEAIVGTDEFLGHFGSYEEAVKAANDYDRRTKVETEGYQTKSGIKTQVNVGTDTEEIGNFVTDLSLIPYIRPQSIRVWAKGLKANTKYFVFFDGEDMTSFTTPYTIPESGDINAGVAQSEGDEIRSDEFGEVLAYIRLPETGKRFRVGTKKIMVTDSPTNAEDPSSYAEGYFVANGMNVKKQNTIMSTAFPITETEEISRTREMQDVEILGPSCMAYSFFVDVPKEEKGVFLTSVDVFIQSLHPELGVWFEIREMSSDGGITRTQVPYSEVWMKRDDPRLKTSDDASVATNVNFEAPVFLMNDTQYAFVIHTEGLNPDTYFFVSRLGETDIKTGDAVTSRGLTGTTYTTNNNLNWDMVPDVDLTVRFNRADFATSPTGTAEFVNNDYEYITIPDDALVPFWSGQEVEGSDKIEIGNTTGDYTPAVGDRIYGHTSGLRAEILEIRGNVMFMDAHGYVMGEVIQFRNNADDEDLDLTGFVVNLDFGKAIVRKIDYKHSRLTLKDSNGQFFVNSTLENVDGQTFPIGEFTTYPYSNMRFNPSTMSFINNGILFDYRGIEAETMMMGPYHSIETESTFRENKRLALTSKSYEKLEKDGEKSMQALATMRGDTRYVSPVIDENYMNNIVVGNIINNDTTDEELPGDGALINKYISKNVTLVKDQNAEDINVFLTAYRPPNTDIKVWARLRNDTDTNNDMSGMGWIEMETTDQRYSSLANQGDFIEIKYTLPESVLTGQNGQFQYTSNGTTYNGFTQFSVKVGLLSDDNHRVPKAADLRVIALQV